MTTSHPDTTGPDTGESDVVASALLESAVDTADLVGKAAPSEPRNSRRLSRLGTATMVFVLLATLFGGIFAVLTPLFWGHDEITQFGRAYQVSHGGFAPQRIPDVRGVAYGGEVPAGIDTAMKYAFVDYTVHPPEPHKLVHDPAAYQRLGAAPLTAEKHIAWFTNTAAYSPVAYVPAAVGIRLGELVGANVGTMVLLTRLAGLLSYVLIVGWALYCLREYRIGWVVAAVALLPIAVFQAGNVTADTVTNALAILVSVLLVKALFLRQQLTRPETVGLLVSAVLLPLTKPTYLLLALLVVVVPGGLWCWRHGRVVASVCAAAGTIGFGLWMRLAAPTGAGTSLMRPKNEWYTVDPGRQFQGVLHDPIRFGGVFLASVARRDREWFTEFFGQLGFSGVMVPGLSVVACLLALVVAAGVSERFEQPRGRWVVACLVVLALSVGMIYGTLYLSFTPVGYYIIDGVQGRYFVPLAVLAFAVMLRWVPWRIQGRAGIPAGKSVAITMTALSVVALAAAVGKYWFVVW